MTIKAVMREKSINFLDTTPSEGTNKWALMNKGIESASVAYNPTVNTRHYIADEGPTSTTTAFDKQLDVTQFAYEGDATFDYVDDLFYNDAKGSDAESNILQVFMYRKQVGGAYQAKLSKCSIQLGEHGGDGGDQLQLAYNVAFNSSAVKGTVKITEGVPVFTATPAVGG